MSIFLYICIFVCQTLYPNICLFKYIYNLYHCKPYISIHFSINLSIYQSSKNISIYQSSNLSILLSILYLSTPFIYPHFYTSIPLCIHIPIHISIYPSILLPILNLAFYYPTYTYISTFLSTYLFNHLSVFCLYIYLSTYRKSTSLNEETGSIQESIEMCYE